MITKFDRMQIASINNAQTVNRGSSIFHKKAVAVPQEETFKHVFNNAKKGNEFAAVILDEWQKNCNPKDDKEKEILQLINKAAEKIFK